MDKPQLTPEVVDELLEHFVDPVHGSPSRGRKPIGVLSLRVDDLRQFGSSKNVLASKGSRSYKLSKLRSQILRHNHVADLDSTLHLSLHQVAAFTDPWTKLRPYHDVDAVSYLACLTCNDKARFIFNIFPKKMIPAGIEDSGFHIKIRAVQGHSSCQGIMIPQHLVSCWISRRAVIWATSFMPRPMRIMIPSMLTVWSFLRFPTDLAMKRGVSVCTLCMLAVSRLRAMAL